jgi:uncharacterized membrane protein
MNNNIRLVVISVIYLILDIIWISSNIGMYNDNIIRVQGKLSEITWKIVVFIFLSYILLLVSILHIAIPLTLNNIKKDDTLIDKLYKSILYGGSVGLCIYGTYNLVSIIIYEKFKYTIAIIDTLWGLFIFSLLTFIYLYL